MSIAYTLNGNPVIKEITLSKEMIQNGKILIQL
jgi:hypothetical protein